MPRRSSGALFKLALKDRVLFDLSSDGDGQKPLQLDQNRADFLVLTLREGERVRDIRFTWIYPKKSGGWLRHVGFVSTSYYHL